MISLKWTWFAQSCVFVNILNTKTAQNAAVHFHIYTFSFYKAQANINWPCSLFPLDRCPGGPGLLCWAFERAHHKHQCDWNHAHYLRSHCPLYLQGGTRQSWIIQDKYFMRGKSPFKIKLKYQRAGNVFDVTWFCFHSSHFVSPNTQYGKACRLQNRILFSGFYTLRQGG